MRTMLLVHVLAGGLGLLLGYVALAASKGTPLHRKSGLLFVYVMTTMSVTGMIVSGVGGVAPAINIPAAALTSYLVITSLTTVRHTEMFRIPALLAGAVMLPSSRCFTGSGASAANESPEPSLASPYLRQSE